MAGISDNRTKASGQKEKLQVLVDALPAATAFFEDLEQMVEDELITAERKDAIIDNYKANFTAQIDVIEAEEARLAEDIAIAGELESDDRLEGITPLIMGTPVITPPPTTYTAEIVTLLADQPTLEAQVAAQIEQINEVMG